MNRFSIITLGMAAWLGLAASSSMAQTVDSAAPSPSTSTPAAPVAATASTDKPQNWNMHFQNTDVVQGDAAFPAKYSGPNSLSDKSQVQETVTTDLYLGKRLWRGAEAHADVLMWQGYGLSQTLGIEAFPNADAYKLGTHAPDFAFARLFIRQTFGLGGPQEDVADDQLTLAGKEDIKRLTITFGRFTPTDISDLNSYASDPHTQFMNWAMVNNLAWDYAADSIGYSPGFTVELNQPKWALRYGFFLMSNEQNGFTGDDQFLMYPPHGAFGPAIHDWAMNAEFERRYTVKTHPGSIRFQTFLNEANMYTFQAATQLLEANGPGANLSSAQSYRYKYGFGLNWEQEVAQNVGLFSRLGWNDGEEEAWAYTDANTSGSLGVSVNGAAWHRPDDTFGLAGVVSGASAAQQKFLEAGGLGILSGDGVLNYGPEEALETYYNRLIARNIHATLDYQFVNNPAFNRDRGPVSIYGIRLHTDF